MTTEQNTDVWPRLRVDDWTDTRNTLHMWLQIVGKLRLEHAPFLNHWWQVTLYVSPRGLTTSLMPYQSEGFDIQFDSSTTCWPSTPRAAADVTSICNPCR